MSRADDIKEQIKQQLKEQLGEKYEAEVIAMPTGETTPLEEDIYDSIGKLIGAKLGKNMSAQDIRLTDVEGNIMLRIGMILVMMGRSHLTTNAKERVTKHPK